MQVKLIAKTRKGQNKLNKSKTDTFDVIETREKVAFTSEKGPWILCQTSTDSRWVHEESDPDFVVEKLIAS